MDSDFEKPPIGQLESNQKDEIKLPNQILSLEERTDFADDYTLSTPETSEEQERFLKASKGAKEIGNNRTCFWNMLVSTVERAGYKPPQDRQTIVLDLGCGKCEEGIVLSAFFGGGSFGNNSENVKLIGIDIKKEDIEYAIHNHSSRDFSEKTIKYVHHLIMNL